MVTIGVVAGVIVAFGTITAGVISVVNWNFSRGRKAEQEDAYRAKVAADPENLKKRLPGSGDDGNAWKSSGSTNNGTVLMWPAWQKDNEDCAEQDNRL